MWQKNWGNLCRKIKLHQSWWEPAGKKNLRRKIPFVWTRKERRPTEEQEYNVDWRLVRIFRQFLHQFFSSHFCGHATKSHFSVTIRQHSIQTSSISHYSRETVFFLNSIRGQVGTYIFASVFVPLIQILTKSAEIQGGCKMQTPQKFIIVTEIKVKWVVN